MIRSKQERLEAVAHEIRTRAACPLARMGRTPVPGEGPADARLLFVGQAPGEEENRTGRPFVGPAGRLLSRTLEEVGLRRDRIFITSVEKFWPPENRMPKVAEVRACLPYLLEQIGVVDPEAVVLLGRLAERTLKLSPALAGRRVFVTVHPAAGFYVDSARARLKADLERVAEYARERFGA